MSDLTKKKNGFEWTALQQKSYKQLKDRLSRSPVLRCADSFLPYELSADASGGGVGAVLTQTDGIGYQTSSILFQNVE